MKVKVKVAKTFPIQVAAGAQQLGVAMTARQNWEPVLVLSGSYRLIA